MCGRFTLTYDDAEYVAASMGVPVDDLKLYVPRFNIAPTDRHPIVRMEYEERTAFMARWGLVNSWAKDLRSGFKNINARGESIDGRRAFKDAFGKRRCVVPADGFYEWEGSKDDRRPSWFHSADGGLLLFAGLYEWWRPSPDDEWIASFTIVTTAANGVVGPVHDRMPVILPAGNVDGWIDPGESDVERLTGLLVPAAEDVLIRRRVSKEVNNVRNDAASLLTEEVQGSLL
jgi:putative SOS response-associated peptidase YedK